MGEPAPSRRPYHPASLLSRASALSVGTKRVCVALVFLPLFYVFTRHLPPWTFFVFISATVLLAQWEFVGLFVDQRSRLQHAIVGFLGSLLLLVAMQWPTVLGLPPALAITLTLLLGYQVGFAPSGVRQLSLFILLFGVLYIGYMLGHLLWLRNRHDGALLVFFVLLVTWAGDAAAYYAGKMWGSRPLAPQLSPKKTREGFLGGLIAAPIVAWLGHLWFLPSVTPLDCLVLGLLLTVLGLIGDLSESALKRHAGVKDSGSLIPGHGGVFDRIDSLLLTVPAFYYYMAFLKGP